MCAASIVEIECAARITVVLEEHALILRDLLGYNHSLIWRKHIRCLLKEVLLNDFFWLCVHFYFCGSSFWSCHIYLLSKCVSIRIYWSRTHYHVDEASTRIGIKE